MTRGLETDLAAAAAHWPERPAFRCRGDGLTYAELHGRARDMAATLQSLGVRPGDRVAIAMTKGLEMPVAVHGIWMAGAAFVPFDPSAPAERLAGILETCAIEVVIGAQRDARILTALAAHRPFALIGAEVDGVSCHGIAPAPKDFAPLVNGPDDIAYVMFTSGSTGAPKGMVHTHGSGRAFAKMWARHYGLRQDDILFCTVPLHFDFCLADFLATPLAGACTELVPEMVQAFPASLASELERSRATIWSTVPYALAQLKERGSAESKDFSSLRWVIFGGEAMAPRQLAEVRQIIGADFSNSYGPAEVNQVTEYTVPSDHDLSQPIPIGHPTDHAELALDENGVLLVASTSMMRGYWQRPDLDATAFVEKAGRRFYRTGDLASVGDDGLWYFHGRADRQVKLRGYRVELEEVELSLCAHPAVLEAAAVVSDDGTALVAWVMTTDPEAVSAKDLLDHAAAALPRYAVPSKIVFQDQFPRTGTGKINRRALKEALS